MYEENIKQAMGCKWSYVDTCTGPRVTPGGETINTPELGSAVFCMKNECVCILTTMINGVIMTRCPNYKSGE